MSPLDFVEPLRDTTHVETIMVEKEVVAQLANFADLPMVEGEGEKEIGDNECSNKNTYSWTDEEGEEGEETNIDREGEEEKNYNSKVKKHEEEGESERKNEGESEK